MNDKGVLLFAFNNVEIDYVKQAIFCAKKTKEHLNLPVALVTDNTSYLEQTYPFYKKYIDILIPVERENTTQVRNFSDGVYSIRKLQWKNHSRPDCYDLTPFNETIVLDVDYIICNNALLNCFKIDEEFLIYRRPTDVVGTLRNVEEFDRISDRSIDMWWATGFYFKKSPFMEMYFNLVKHIKENWPFYRLVYQIPNNNYRNDFSFSIAIHILRGFQNSFWPSTMPGKMYLAYDSDMLEEINNNKLTIVADYKGKGHFIAITVEDSNVHIMNKFSLGRMVDKEFENE
tara:strand:+ start:2621 stop:3481 length:861 start_codon:yes stop_codon:yes gene_type:complete